MRPPSPSVAEDPKTSRLLDLYARVVRIRRFEERVSTDYRDGWIPGIIHLSIGQEAVAAGVSANLAADDYVVTTHRGHGHILAKGAPMSSLMAEIWGKATGVCGGKGGSMHIAHVATGCLGANSVVGAGQPFAVGVGMALRQRTTGQIVASYFGDGAISTGAFHEAAVLASLFSPPVLFVAENNQYAETTGSRFHLRGGRIVDRLVGYGIRLESIDGMDVEAVDHAARELVGWIRERREPVVLECETYRFHGHFEGDLQRYQTRDEIELWRARDPLGVCRRRLDAAGVDAGVLQRIEDEIEREVADAAAFAAQSPMPDPSEVVRGVYPDA